MSDIKTSPIAFDLTINIPLVMAMVGGIAAGGAAYANIVQRVEMVEDRTRNLPAIETQLARIDERSAAGRESLQRIERQLERDQ